MNKSKHLLIIDNSIYREVYRPAEHWSRYAGSDFAVSVVRKDEAMPSPDRFSHIIITGSEASITRPDGWVYPQLDLIRKAVEKRIPLLGSCHGHQMIAAALGGFETVRTAGTPEFGWFELDILQDDELFSGASRPIWSFCVHWDEVHSLPADCIGLAKSAACNIQVFRSASAPVYGIQAHPEINPEEGERLITDFLPLFPRMKEFPVHRPARDSGLVETIMKNFLAL